MGAPIRHKPLSDQKVLDDFLDQCRGQGLTNRDVQCILRFFRTVSCDFAFQPQIPIDGIKADVLYDNGQSRGGVYLCGTPA